MARHQTAQDVYNDLNRLKLMFLNMSSDERIKYISRFDRLTSKEQVVLIQCRKYMSAEEKRAYKKVKDALAHKEESQSQPE